MKKIVKEDLPIERFYMDRNEAVKYFEEKNEPYKVELINDLPEGEQISFYRQGEFTGSLCRTAPYVNRSGKGIPPYLSRRRLLERRLKKKNAQAYIRHSLP